MSRPFLSDTAAFLHRFLQMAKVITRPALFLLLGMLTTASNAAADDQETILIVDGSGSMWGKFDKEHKIVTVRKILPKQLESYEGKGNLGIVSYGHRWKSNCRDIELVTPISKISAASHGKTLSKLSARGKTPITGALKLAYSKFGKDAKIKQIILLADGAENCRADPCQFVKEVLAKDKSLTTHVIAYGMGKKDAKKLQCISTLSQGSFFRPQNREELRLALGDLFGKTLERKWQIVVKKDPPKKKEKPGLFLKAWLGNDTLQLTEKVKWLVYKTADDALNNTAPLLISEKAAPVLQLESGSYYVQLVNGKMGSGKTIQVDKDKHQNIDFRLNAGIVSLVLDVKQGFLDSVKDYRISLLAVKKGSPPVPVASTQNRKESFTLAAGDYRLVTQLKNISHETGLSLKAGEKKTVQLPLKVGLLSLSAVQNYGGKKITNISYKIMRKDASSDSEFHEYFRLASASPKIVLPVGLYYVAAKSDLAVAIENFEIKAGQNNKQTLNLNAGQVILSSTLSNGKKFRDGEITYSVTQSGLSAIESQHTLLKTSIPGKTINLPIGSYIISSSVGKGGSLVEQAVEIGAGQLQTLDFVHKAGYTNLSCIRQGGKQVRRNIFWQVINGQGQSVSRSTTASYRILLDQGDYTAQALYNGKKYSAKFTVLASEKPNNVQLTVQ